MSRKSTPISPPQPSPPVLPLSTSDQNKRKTRSSSREVAAARHQLQNIEKALPPLKEESPPPQDDGLRDSSSVGLASSSAGLELQDQLDSLDRDAIIDHLTELYTDSSALLSLVEGSGAAAIRASCKKLLEPSSPLRRRFRVRKKRLLDSRQHYRVGQMNFLDPGLIVRKVAGDIELEAINHGPWRPDPVLYLANLALQLIAVLSTSDDDRDTFIQFMSSNFPHPFVGSGEFGIGPDLIEETTELNVDILTQLYIQKAEVEHSEGWFDPDVLAHQIFLEHNRQIQEFVHQDARAKVIRRLALMRDHFGTDAEGFIDINALKEHFSWPDFVSRVARWTLARKKELEEMVTSKGGIDNLSELLLSENLQHDGFRAESAPAAETPTVNEAQGELNNTRDKNASLSAKRRALGPLKGKALGANASRLKALKANFAARQSGASTDLVIRQDLDRNGEIVRTPSPTLDDGGEPATAGKVSDQMGSPQDLPGDDIVPTQQTRIVLETIQRHKEQSEKENRKVTAKKPSLFDRQQGAVRVPFSELSDEDNIASQGSGKRQRPEADESSDGDDFETDVRPTKKPHVGAGVSRQPTIASGSLARRQRDIEEDAGDMGDHDDGGPADQRASTSRQQDRPQRPSQGQSSRTLPFTSSQPARSSTQQQPSRQPLYPILSTPLPPSSAPIRPRAAPNPSPPPRRRTEPTRQQQEPPRSQVARVNERARQLAMIQRSALNRPRAQIRTPYTEDEVNRLMEMIELHGTKWALILMEDSIHPDGPQLQDRGQVQLKDKARNIKLDFLK